MKILITALIPFFTTIWCTTMAQDASFDLKGRWISQASEIAEEGQMCLTFLDDNKAILEINGDTVCAPGFVAPMSGVAQDLSYEQKTESDKGHLDLVISRMSDDQVFGVMKCLWESVSNDEVKFELSRTDSYPTEFSAKGMLTLVRSDKRVELPLEEQWRAALHRMDQEKMKQVLESGFDPNTKLKLDVEGAYMLPLMEILHNSYGFEAEKTIQILEVMIDAGADVNRTDSHGSPVLPFALNTNDKKVVSFLVSKGAKMDCELFDCNKLEELLK